MKGTSSSALMGRLRAMAQSAAERHGIDSGLFRALITQESGWNSKARSSVGALGLGQLMPGTAKALGVSNPFDPEQNLDASARYLRSLLDRFGGDESMGLAAYNAGPGAVEKHGGVPPFKETQDYIARIQSLRGQGGGSYADPVLSAFGGGTPAAKTSSAPAAGYQDPVLAAFSGQSAAPAGRNQGSIADLASKTKANLTGLHPELRNALASAAGDLNQQGIDLGSLITSGFRSTEDQARLYANRGSNPNPVAPPGHSRHEQGNAVDISLRSLSPDQQGAVLNVLQSHGLTRPVANDPVHWQLSGSSPSAAAVSTPAAAGAYQDPVLKAFSDRSSAASLR